MALAAEGNDKAAIDELKVTAQMRPNYEGVYYRLGRSLAKLKVYADAIASFERELKNGEDYDTELELSDAYRASGQLDKAAAAKSRAEQLRKP
jgi:tetratricopeptide (TPR) repeat protein